MPPSRDAQLQNRRLRKQGSAVAHHYGAYVAELVSEDAVSAFAQHHGGGDGAVEWVARNQLDVISIGQLRRAGVGRGAIASRERKGALRRMFRGVYLVGHTTPLPGAIELAAVLAYGDNTVVSHRSAAALWGLVAPPPMPEVTVIGRNCRPRHGLRVHNALSLDARFRALRFGIPVTSVARTVIDVAGGADSHEVERVIGDAFAQRLLRDGQLEAEIDRCSPHPGVGQLRAILKAQGGPALTRSEAERRMRRLLKDAGLPPAQTNARVEGFEVDFYWPGHKLVVEVDGYQFHADRAAFERDRRKGLALAAAGLQVIRITWRQLVEEPVWVAVQLSRALADRS